MKTISVFGAGKSSAALIQYLLQQGQKEQWKVIVADANLEEAQSKVGNHPLGSAIYLNIHDEVIRKKIVSESSLVISLLPPALHILLAKDCLHFKKNLVTASYIDDELKKLSEEINNAGLIFLGEAGLDPGIDHMSAKKLIDSIEEKGGQITSFLSHCGGLVAEESDDNPWHYKISWNPLNVVNAGKAGATFLQNGEIKTIGYPQLFSAGELININGADYQWYPNRDSLPYKEIYGLKKCTTFIRTTLRHPHFISGWKKIVHYGFTDENIKYDTTDKSLKELFIDHLKTRGFKQDVYQQLVEKEGNLFADQLLYLGLNDNQITINKGRCSIAEILKFSLETKLSLHKNDKDKVVMMHDIGYTLNNTKYRCTAHMTIIGNDNKDTAMARTVGLPLGIAAKLILNGSIRKTGLHIPIHKEIYEPILNELQFYGIHFEESVTY